MVRSIKLFQFIQKYNRFIGFDPHEEPNKIDFTSNRKKLIFFLVELQFIAESAAFMSFDANTIFEYGITFFAISSSIFAMALHSIHSRQIKINSNFIENSDKFIEKRKWSVFMQFILRC